MVRRLSRRAIVRCPSSSPAPSESSTASSIPAELPAPAMTDHARRLTARSACHPSAPPPAGPAHAGATKKTREKKNKKTAARTRRERPAATTPAPVPCLGCVRSALRGKSTGQCFYTTGAGSRCWRCASGHHCEPLPEEVRGLAVRMVRHLLAGRKKEGGKYRTCIAQLLKDMEEEGDDAKSWTGFSDEDPGQWLSPS